MTKIVSEQEVLRWFEEGRTYAWMSQQYRDKYDLEMVASAWGNFRRRRGLTRRIQRDDDLIPWAVKKEHRNAFQVAMLRAEARRRAGAPLRAADQKRLPSFLRRMEENGTVVDYDPDSLMGFKYVPRQDGDTDIIRKPRAKSSTRLNADA